MKEVDPRLKDSICLLSEKDMGVVSSNHSKEKVILSPSFQEELKLLGLNERLDRILREYPDRYQPDTVLRVKQVIHHDLEQPQKRRPPNLFQIIDDFQLYYQIHPEWHSMSTKEMHDDKQSGANRFYETYGRWVQVVSNGDRKVKKELFQQLFSRNKTDNSIYKTIDDWLAEFQRHPEWQRRSSVEMDGDVESGASAFYASFIRWIKKQAGEDEAKRSELVKQLLRSDRVHRRPETIDGWIAEFQMYPEWLGINPKAMLNDKRSDAARFYSSFQQWVKKIAKGDRKIKRELIDRIFPPRHFKSAHLTTIEDWKKEFDKHPEWYEKSMIEIESGSDPKGKTFVCSFRKWTRREARGDSDVRSKLTEQIFKLVRLNRTNLKTIDDWLAEFQRHPEWQGRTPIEMHRDVESGADAFHASFNIWLRETSKTEEERTRYVRMIFPNARMYTRETKEQKQSISPEKIKEALDMFFENP